MDTIYSDSIATDPRDRFSIIAKLHKERIDVYDLVLSALKTLKSDMDYEGRFISTYSFSKIVSNFFSIPEDYAARVCWEWGFEPETGERVTFS